MLKRVVGARQGSALVGDLIISTPPIRQRQNEIPPGRSRANPDQCRAQGGMTCRPDSREAPLGRTLPVFDSRSREADMDSTTLLIIILVIVLLGGGGYYGRGRWW